MWIGYPPSLREGRKYSFVSKVSDFVRGRNCLCHVFPLWQILHLLHKGTRFNCRWNAVSAWLNTGRPFISCAKLSAKCVLWALSLVEWIDLRQRHYSSLTIKDWMTCQCPHWSHQDIFSQIVLFMTTFCNFSRRTRAETLATQATTFWVIMEVYKLKVLYFLHRASFKVMLHGTIKNDDF